MLFSAILICCIVTIALFLLPAKIGDVIYGHKAEHEVTAIQIIESSTTNAPINIYYTSSQNYIESFLALLSDMDVKLLRFSPDIRRVVEYVSTLYEITICKADTEAVRLTLTAEGNLYTKYAVYSISEPQKIDLAMSQIKFWNKSTNS